MNFNRQMLALHLKILNGIVSLRPVLFGFEKEFLMLQEENDLIS